MAMPGMVANLCIHVECTGGIYKLRWRRCRDPHIALMHSKSAVSQMLWSDRWPYMRQLFSVTPHLLNQKRSISMNLACKMFEWRTFVGASLGGPLVARDRGHFLVPSTGALVVPPLLHRCYCML